MNIVQEYISPKFNTKRICGSCQKKYDIRESKRLSNKYKIMLLASPCCNNVYNNQEEK